MMSVKLHIGTKLSKITKMPTLLKPIYNQQKDFAEISLLNGAEEP